MSDKIQLSFKSGGIALVDTGSGLLEDRMTISGLASPFGGPPDAQGDVIEKGAYRESLIARPTIPILWQHDSHEPIGKTTWMAEDEIGLLFKAKITETRRGIDSWKLIADNVISGISIGYDTKLSLPGSALGELRRLSKLDLFELSLVTWPAAARARITNWASGWELQGLKDALLIHEVDFLMRKGYRISNRRMLMMLDAQKRDLERKIHGGKTSRELLYEVCYELQELKKVMKK